MLVFTAGSFYVVVIDCVSMLFLDAVGMVTLWDLCRDYGVLGIILFLVCCSFAVREVLRRGGFFGDD